MPSDIEDNQAAGQPHARKRSPSSDGQSISSLPPELFIKILAEVDLFSRRNGLNWNWNWIVPYQLVSRRWRDIISSTPLFWQQINVSSSPEWLELCLTRCAGTPATVVVWHPTQPEATFATLSRFASSLRGIYVHSDHPDMASLTGLGSFLATPLPALKSLSLEGIFDDKTVVDVEIPHALVPGLTTLHLRNCTAPSDTEVYTSLRSLSLSGSVWSLTYRDFLDTMNKSHALEHLALDENILEPFANDIRNLETDYPTLTLPIALPRLQSVKLSGPCDVLFHLLENMHVPQARRFELTNCLDDDEPDSLVARLLRAPDLHLRIPFLSSPRVISLRCWDVAPFLLSVRCGPDGHAYLSVDYGMVHNEVWPRNEILYSNIIAIMDTFPTASVDTLEIEGPLDDLAVGTWQRVFQTFSSLRTLRLKGWGTLDFRVRPAPQGWCMMERRAVLSSPRSP